MQRVVRRSLYGAAPIDYTDGKMIRFADDTVFACRTMQTANKIYETVKEFLKPRGLILSAEKTKVGTIYDGFDLLGFHIQRTGWKVEITPAEKSVKRVIAELHELITTNTKSQRDLIVTLNRKLKGWAGYYRAADAYEAFRTVDTAVAASLLEAIIQLHPKTQRKKLIDRYFYRDDSGKIWFACRNDKSVRVIHLRDTYLLDQRAKVTDFNPFFERKRLTERKQAEEIAHINSRYRPIFLRQNGKCLYCGCPLLPDQAKQLVAIDHSKPQTLKNSAYVHEICIQSDYELRMIAEDVETMTEFDVLKILENIGRNARHISASAPFRA